MGGAAQNTLLTVLHLPPSRFVTTLITGPSAPCGGNSRQTEALARMTQSIRERGTRILVLPDLVRRVSPHRDFKALVSLTGILRDLSPDGVHTHTSKAGFLGRIAARAAGVPWVVHTPHGHVYWGHFPPFPSWGFRQLDRIAARMSDHLVALTPREALDYRRLRTAPARKISVIPSGVLLEEFARASAGRAEIRARLKIPPDSVVVGFVGWLWPVKGVRFLVDAVIRIIESGNRVFLLVVGEGEQGPELVRRVERAQMNRRILFLGWRPDVNRLMGAMDLLVLPSLNEGMGRVLVEAMAAGLPVIGSRVGGIRDLVRHGENGLLVPPGDSAALEQAIRELIEDPDRRRAMGERGRSLCSNYALEVMMTGIQELYERMQAGRGPGGDGARGAGGRR